MSPGRSLLGFRGTDLGFANPSVMQSRGNQRGRTSRSGERVQISQIANTATGNDFRFGISIGQIATKRLRTDALSRANAMQVEHDHPPDAGTGGHFGDSHRIQRSPGGHLRQRPTIAKIETEDESIGADGFDECCQRIGIAE